jgi:hypothetical protein
MTCSSKLSKRFNAGCGSGAVPPVRAVARRFAANLLVSEQIGELNRVRAKNIWYF